MKPDFDTREPKTILIVDDEKDLLQTISDYFELFRDQISLLTAPNGREALEILRHNDVSLLITDVMMPEMTGLELLAHVISEYPTIPSIVFSAYGNPNLEQQLAKLGCLRFFDKPFDLDDLMRTILEILEQSESTGYINALSLESFLQLVSIEQKTCIVEVLLKSQDRKCYIYFSGGAVVDATFGDLSGEDAFFSILARDRSDIAISIHFRSLNHPRRIDRSLTHLIMDAARLMDESSREADSDGTNQVSERDDASDAVSGSSFSLDLDCVENDDVILDSILTENRLGEPRHRQPSGREEEPARDARAGEIFTIEADTSSFSGQIFVQATGVKMQSILPVESVSPAKEKERNPDLQTSIAHAPGTLKNLGSQPQESVSSRGKSGVRSPATATKSGAQQLPGKVESTAWKKVITEHLLDWLSKNPDVLLTVVVDQNGDLVAFSGRQKKKNSSELGRASLQILEGVQQIARKMMFQSCKTVTIEYSRHIIVSKPVKDFLLVILLTDQKALGMIRFNLQKYITEKGGRR